MKLGVVATLLGLFLWELITSGLSTAWTILRPGARPRPGLARLDYGALGPRGAALLGGMITLTPGTTTIDIDLERHELLVHLLDAAHAEATARTIRRRFQRRIAELFPEGPSR